MRARQLMLPVVMLGALLLVACRPGAAGTGTSPNARPTRLEIKAFSVVDTSVQTVMVDDAQTVQHVYTTALALPQAPANQACPAIAGPHYELTFLENGQVVATAIADRGGCGSVTFGASDVRQANDAFWQLLNLVIAEAAPPVQPDRLEVMSFAADQTPPLLSRLTSSEQTKQLYDAMRALPSLPENAACPEHSGARYTLLFFKGEKRYQALLDAAGCISGPLELSEHHQADDAFWHLLKQTLASTPAEPARPDTLNMKIEPASDDPSSTASASTIQQKPIVQQVYDAIFALPQQQANQSCPATRGTLYGLSFSLDGSELLSFIADKSGCGTVTAGDGYVRLADQHFWALLHQAETGA
jgi:hypothetical protein